MKFDSSSGAFGLSLTWNGAFIGGSSTADASGWYYHTLTTPYTVPSTGKYYIRTGGRVKRSETNPYRGTGYCLIYDGERITSCDMTFKVYAENTAGDYESQGIDVGQGVEWSNIYWSANLDGATLVVKTKTSEDDIDWSEAWQEIASSGGSITGSKRYLKYRIELTNATENTYVDDIDVKYYV